MRIYQDYYTEAEIISDSYPFQLLYNEAVAQVQSKMVVLGEVNVDVGGGNYFGGKNQDEDQEKGGDDKPEVAKVNNLIDAFGYVEIGLDKKGWQAYFKDFAKLHKDRLTAANSPRLAPFMAGLKEFMGFVNKNFD